MTKREFFEQWVLSDFTGTFDQKIKRAEEAWDHLDKYFKEKEPKTVDGLIQSYIDAGHDWKSLSDPSSDNRCVRCGSCLIDLSEDLIHGSMRSCSPKDIGDKIQTPLPIQECGPQATTLSGIKNRISLPEEPSEDFIQGMIVSFVRNRMPRASWDDIIVYIDENPHLRDFVTIGYRNYRKSCL